MHKNYVAALIASLMALGATAKVHADCTTVSIQNTGNHDDGQELA